MLMKTLILILFLVCCPAARAQDFAASAPNHAANAQNPVANAQSPAANAQSHADAFPADIFSGMMGKFHVQGIAYDHKRQCIYMSFTTSLVKFDMQGRILASVTGLTGHLGSIGINPDDGKLYGSLEYKHDAVGQGIAQKLATQNDLSTGFYIAIIDLDRLNAIGMAPDDVLTTVYIKEAADDCAAKVTNRGRSLDHRYAASGIDGMTFAPQWGKTGGRNYLYVAYGVYRDTTRTDNDHQVLLCYDVRDWDRYAQPIDPAHIHQSGPKHPRAKYFVYTGSTDWGVQNLEYDAESGQLFMACYHGFKSGWPKYNMYVLDIRERPYKDTLKGVEPRTRATLLRLLPTGVSSPDGLVWGWEDTRGSTGITALGQGLFYLSEDGWSEAEDSHYTHLHLYRWDERCGFVRQ